MQTYVDFDVTPPSNFASGYYTVVSKPSDTADRTDIAPAAVQSYTDFDSTANQSVTPKIAAGGAEVCTTWWELDNPMKACVEWQQGWQRLKSTGDTTSDIIIADSAAYSMTAFIGNPATTTNIFWPSETVDFTYWADNPVQLHGVSLVASATVALVAAASTLF